jgi:pilus assembly protein CpaC
MKRGLRTGSAGLALILAAAAGSAPVQADGPYTYSPPRPAAPRMAPVETLSSTAAVEQNQVLRVDLSTGAGARQLRLPKGKSAIIELPVDIRDMLVSNPKVADAVLRSPRRVFVLGNEIGQTDAVFFDAAGRRILSLDIKVDQDTNYLAQTISRVLPGSSVAVEALNESVILTGQVMTASDADKAGQIAARFVSKPENVLNMLSIAGKDQVMLKVRIVEMQRNVIKQLGFNMNAVLNQIGEPQYMLGNAASFAVNGSILGGLSAGYNLDTTRQPVSPVVKADGSDSGLVFQNRDSQIARISSGAAGDSGLNQASSMIQAFERVGLVRTLAEPNLTVVSGEAGKFLVGGEFPVPTGQDTTGRVTLEFKPYGVGLGFTPVVLSGGRISVKLSTEVSELSSAGAFTLGTGEGGYTLSVPGLTVRRAESTAELPSGGSLMIAGLLQQQTRQNIDALPGMTSLPVLGTLFRSRDYLNGETELVIIISAYIVDPTHAQDLQTPVDGLRIASDSSTILLGRLNQVVKTQAGPEGGRAYQGPVGYVIE